MDVTIKINMDNAAFQDSGYPSVELSRILFELATWIDGRELSNQSGKSIYDLNGNYAGHIIVLED